MPKDGRAQTPTNPQPPVRLVFRFADMEVCARAGGPLSVNVGQRSIRLGRDAVERLRDVLTAHLDSADAPAVPSESARRPDLECPRARSMYSPCIVRDGALALADDGVCVACRVTPRRVLANLKSTAGAATNIPVRVDGRTAAATVADLLPGLVGAYVDLKATEGA